MLRDLIESIRLEALKPGAVSHPQSQGRGGEARRAAVKVARLQSKREMRKVAKDPTYDPLADRRSTRGYR